MAATEKAPDFAHRAKLFGDKVRSRRAELGLSERKLAEATGLSRGYVALLLKDRGSHKDGAGEYKPLNPTLDVIWRLAEALDVEPMYLVDPHRGVEARTR
ncbi:MAG: helix-turn-helix domain-containing protein [Nocardioidaceae bacterium]|nr:helix-turn-helix domain-containing protein [Nocardioidaceae bacterium]MCL2613620.1 helix-turn-helix domain-containing protein [Nocardioidaceae bacterium]